LVVFLTPLIGRTYNFRNKVLEKNTQVKAGGVAELASLVGMGRKNFKKQFQKEFGTSPAQWMLQEKAKRLYVFLHEPEVTIADAMDEFYFNSSSHFNRFCKHFFQKTPGSIIKEARQQKKRKKNKV
jgi:AraC-like DNA-binding protein